MAALPVPGPSHEGSRRLVEALGFGPVLIFLGLLIWVLLAAASPGREAGLGRTQPRATPAPAFAVRSGPPGEGLLIVLTVSEERAADIRALLEAEAALRELLQEASRNAQVVATASDDEAVRIADAIRAEVPDAQVDVVIVP